MTKDAAVPTSQLTWKTDWGAIVTMTDRAFTERIQRLAGAAHAVLEVWDEYETHVEEADLQEVMTDLRYALQDYLDAGGTVRIS